MAKYSQEIDLHGLTLEQALAKVYLLIDQVKIGSWVKVITGKGRHSKDGVPVLFPGIHNLLNHSNKVENVSILPGDGAFAFRRRPQQLFKLSDFIRKK